MMQFIFSHNQRLCEIRHMSSFFSPLGLNSHVFLASFCIGVMLVHTTFCPYFSDSALKS